MEQKTEESQAVDELLADLKKAAKLSEAVGRSRGDNRYAQDSKSVTELVKLEMSIEERIRELDRAALKAQPAPTEAQGESPFKFVPWSKEAEMIEGWTKAEKARTEARGEDRARLADGYITGTVVSDPNASWIAIRYESMEQAAAAADLLFGMIDRARASAETGGVKP